MDMPQRLTDIGSMSVLLFDLDGTLIETHIDFPAMMQAMKALAAQNGVPDTVIADKDILGVVEAASSDLTQRGGDGAALRAQAFAILEEMEVVGCAESALLPGADILLQTLARHHLPVGIVTRNCRRVSLDLLARYQLPYTILLTRDDVRVTKPHPDHLWEALRLLDGQPEKTAMIGDHPMDIRAGREAGCARTIGILGQNSLSWFDACPPDMTVSTPGDLIRFWNAQDPVPQT